MPKFETLYYPHFEPPQAWFRNYLMVYDTIWTIVPTDVESQLSSDFWQLVDIIPGSHRTIPPNDDDKELDNQVFDRIDNAFKIISEEKQGVKGDIRIQINIGGTMEVDGHCFLHNQKLNKKLYTLLDKYSLIEPNLGPALTTSFEVVETRAANLIVSLIADRIAKRSSFVSTITNENLDFAVNALNALEEPNRSLGLQARDKLACSILKFEIPYDIAYMSPRDYKIIRDDYSSIREAFHSTVMHLSNLYRLEAIENVDELSNKIHSITREFHKEISDYRKSKSGRRIKKWGPLSIGSLVTITSAILGEGPIAIASAAATIFIELVKEAFLNNDNETDKDTVKRLFAGMKEDINAATIRRLL